MTPLRRLWTAGFAIAALGGAVGGEALQPRPAHSAETLRLVVGGPLVVSVSVDSLATYADTGQITGNLRPLARVLDAETLGLVRSGLRQSIPLSASTVAHLSYSPLGRDTLLNLGLLLRPHPQVNGFHALRAAVINAAATHPEGWTLVDVLRAFPTEVVQIELADLLTLRRSLAVYLSYNQAVVTAVQQQAAAEAAAQSFPGLATLADLNQPGPYTVQRTTVVVENPALRQTDVGLTVNYDFPVDVYLPQDTVGPAPVIILSHGFGDVKESFTFIAEHLASHGFVTLLPDHVGSDLNYRQQFLSGRLNTLLSPMEFINRPQEISFLIDELERLVATSSDWAARLNLDRIGIMGDSLGGTTALSLAGAEINFARLNQSCDPDRFSLNFSLYLECRARYLPPQNYRLKDDRLRAVYVTHPMGSHLFGPEGMGQIDIPLMMVVGSNDIVAPAVTEQLHPFVWVPDNPKYLALLQVGTHFSSKPGRDLGASGGEASLNQLLGLIEGQHRDVGTRYSKALSVAFWQTYLGDRPDRLPYLSASYGLAASVDQPMRLDIIQSLTPQQIEAVYGRTPPVAVIPPPVTAPPPPRNETVLAEIARTGALKVAFRKDAPPFGYLAADGAWAGYCGDLAIALSQHLATTLNRPTGIELVELTSTLQNRFDLVRDGSVHLECGPNSIRQDLSGIAFSNPLYVTGARFLVSQARAATNFNQPGLRIGVLQDTTTEAFARQSYPNASIVTFAGADDRAQAVQAVVAGQVDAFLGDSVLSTAELERQALSVDQFALVPEVPLTCEYYGLTLPDSDPQWRATVNAFLAEAAALAALEQEARELDFCLNR